MTPPRPPNPANAPSSQPGAGPLSPKREPTVAKFPSRPTTQVSNDSLYSRAFDPDVYRASHPTYSAYTGFGQQTGFSGNLLYAPTDPAVIEARLQRSVLPQFKPEKEDGAHKAQQRRTEMVNISEQALIYGVAASVEGAGMYMQRVDDASAVGHPMYNPENPNADMASLEVLMHIEAILGFWAYEALGIESYADYASDPVLQENIEFHGDQFFSLGNFLKLGGQFFYAREWRICIKIHFETSCIK